MILYYLINELFWTHAGQDWEPIESPATLSIPIEGITSVASWFPFNVRNNAVRSALFGWNIGFGFTGASAGSISDVLVRGNHRTGTAPSCTDIVDTHTGREWCIENDFSITGAAQENFSLFQTSSAGGAVMSPTVDQHAALGPLEAYGRYTTDLAPATPANCPNSGVNCYVWDLALADTPQTALDYYPCSQGNAWEVLLDERGNDDGICDPEEDCIWMRNLGAYQGHGERVLGCNNGTQGRIFTYEHNGK